VAARTSARARRYHTPGYGSGHLDLDLDSAQGPSRGQTPSGERELCLSFSREFSSKCAAVVRETAHGNLFFLI